MIDVCQWRASIGCWSCRLLHVDSLGSQYFVRCSHNASKAKRFHGLVAGIICFSITFLLILSGDVELNPGPSGGDPGYYSVCKLYILGIIDLDPMPTARNAFRIRKLRVQIDLQAALSASGLLKSWVPPITTHKHEQSHLADRISPAHEKRNSKLHTKCAVILPFWHIIWVHPRLCIHNKQYAILYKRKQEFQ